MSKGYGLPERFWSQDTKMQSIIHWLSHGGFCCYLFISNWASRRILWRLWIIMVQHLCTCDKKSPCLVMPRYERVFSLVQTFAYFFVMRYLNASLWVMSRSQWPRGLSRRSSATRLLRSWVRIQPGAWKFVCCECCVLSGRGLCDKLITRPEESYWLWCIVVCDQETLRMRRPWPTLGRSATKKNYGWWAESMAYLSRVG